MIKFRILNSLFRLDGHFFDRSGPMNLGVIFDQKLRFCIFEENKNIHERWGVLNITSITIAVFRYVVLPNGSKKSEVSFGCLHSPEGTCERRPDVG